MMMMSMTIIVAFVLLMVVKKSDDRRAKVLEATRRTLTGATGMLKDTTPDVSKMKTTRPDNTGFARIVHTTLLALDFVRQRYYGLGVPSVSERGYYPMRTYTQQREARVALSVWCQHMVKWAKSVMTCNYCGCKGVSGESLCPQTEMMTYARSNTRNEYVDEQMSTTSVEQQRRHQGSANLVFVQASTTVDDWTMVNMYGNRAESMFAQSMLARFSNDEAAV
jgi:hypothetical protein